jgi:hypothetical protein
LLNFHHYLNFHCNYGQFKYNFYFQKSPYCILTYVPLDGYPGAVLLNHMAALYLAF